LLPCLPFLSSPKVSLAPVVLFAPFKLTGYHAGNVDLYLRVFSSFSLLVLGDCESGKLILFFIAVENRAEINPCTSMDAL
jgi:hypothetical protein